MTRGDIADVLEGMVKTLRSEGRITWPIVVENDRDQNLGFILVIWERKGPGRTVSSLRLESTSAVFASGSNETKVTARRWKQE